MVKSSGSLQINEVNRGRIVGLWNGGSTYHEISTCIGVSLEAVSNIFNRLKIGSISPKKISGRPKKLDSNERENLKKTAMSDRRCPLQDLSKKFNIHFNTARTCLKEQGYMKKVALKKPLLTEFQRNSRFAWSKKIRESLKIFSKL